MPLIANMRMYGVNAEVAALWRELAEWVAERSAVDLVVFDHPPPLPMGELWGRDDMGLVQMCGWPFWRAEPRPHLVAAPVPDHVLADDRPLYWSTMVVRRDDPVQSLDDTFGGRIGWTVEDSHSGFNAPQHLLLTHFQRSGAPLYAQSVGPLITPRRAIDALLGGDADVVPVDGFFHLLLERYEPDIAGQLRIVATTPCAPMPPFVASRGVAADDLEKLRGALTAAHQVPQAHRLLQALSIRRFDVPQTASYDVAETWHRQAVQQGYGLPL